MPSSPNYKRDYKQEAATESKDRRENRAKRMAARRAYEKASGEPVPKGFDVDHKRPLSKGGGNSKGNLQLQKSGANRSYPRTKTGGMRSKYD